MTFFIKFPLAISFAFRSNYVDRLFRDKLFEKALKKSALLQNDQKKFYEKSGLGDKLILKNMLRQGEILFDMGKYIESIKLLKKTIKKIKENEKFNSDEKKYLLYFARLLIFGAHCGLKEHSEEPILGEINLANISRPTMRNFPVRDHPDWYKYFPEEKW